MKTKLINIINRNNLIKNLLVVAGGTAGAQLIALILMPIITRLYGPESYGKLGIFMTVITILTPIATLALPSAIVLPEKDYESRKIAQISILNTLLFSFILSLVFIFGKNLLQFFSSIESLGNLIWFLPLALIFTSLQIIYTEWMIRKKHFNDLSKVAIGHSALNYGTQAVIGFKYPFTYVLISAHTIGILFRYILLLYFIKSDKHSSLNDNKNIQLKSSDILRKYHDFPVFRAPEMMLSAISQGMPIMLLSGYFGLTAAGFYALTRTVLSIPVTLLGSSIQSVFYPHFNEAILNKSKTTGLLVKSARTLFYIGLLPLIITIVFAPFAFSIVFGKEWYEAGIYAQWLSPWFLFTLVSRPSIAAIPVFKLQGWLLAFEFLSTILKIAALFAGYYFFQSPIVSVALFSIVGSISFIILILKVVRTSATIDQKTT